MVTHGAATHSAAIHGTSEHSTAKKGAAAHGASEHKAAARGTAQRSAADGDTPPRADVPQPRTRRHPHTDRHARDRCWHAPTAMVPCIRQVLAHAFMMAPHSEHRPTSPKGSPAYTAARTRSPACAPLALAYGLRRHQEHEYQRRAPALAMAQSKTRALRQDTAQCQKRQLRPVRTTN